MVNVVIMMVIWGVVSFNFFIINFDLKYIKGSIYFNTAIDGIA